MSRHFVACVTLCFLWVVVGCSDKTRDDSSDGSDEGPAQWVIDADVPGTEIYLHGQCLGQVPYTLTREFVENLGLEPPGWCLETDGWGGGIRLGEFDENEVELSFRVPDEVAAGYRRVETPWGRRTGPSGTWDGRETLLARMDPVADEGLDLVITVSDRHTDPQQPANVNMQAKNVTRERIEGSDPYVFILYGTYDVPWRRRNMKEVNLPQSWCAFEPGEEKQVTLQFDAPNISESFSVLVTFHINELNDPERTLVSVYSNVEMLRTRYPNCPPRCCDDD